ncbi:DUF2247 family protein [Sporolactobacillus laevolacticus]|uniref:DUF2247 domain-containing protein n=1 Tax=Sporolactobacillus laevolacticus DSM 442 TaxID=1395513 RepID=V6IZ32_9BACL|nr:DUF2247 family protein [Sporolactobacillus laevolacticus]EST12732.1 hypothetical protein P343_04960 [Sporolactobacillus laevolacticus DSM 442]
MIFSINIFKKNKINYDWKTLYVGFNLGLIKNSDITNYAVDFLGSHSESDNQNIVELAWGGNDIDYERLLRNILRESNVDDLVPDSDVWQLETRKWRFGILTDLEIMYQNDPEELLNKIAEVYADFDYPEDMDSFINYLTPKAGYDPSLYSPKENVARLMNYFNVFLNKEQQYLQKIA